MKSLIINPDVNLDGLDIACKIEQIEAVLAAAGKLEESSESHETFILIHTARDIAHQLRIMFDSYDDDRVPKPLSYKRASTEALQLREASSGGTLTADDLSDEIKAMGPDKLKQYIANLLNEQIDTLIKIDYCDTAFERLRDKRKQFMKQAAA